MLSPYEFECNYSVKDDEFLSSVSYLLGPALLPGNTVQTLTHNAWDTALKVVRQAKRSVCIEANTSLQDLQGEQLTDLLAEKAESGIPVHLVLTKTTPQEIFTSAQLKKFLKADVEVFSLKSGLRLTSVFGKKAPQDFTLITVDGFCSALISPHRELGFYLQGPVVGQIQASFNESWMQVQEQVAHGEFYFADSLAHHSSTHAPDSKGIRAQYFDAENIKTPHKFYLNILYTIGVAKNSLVLTEPVFKVIDGLDREIKKAEQRGVQLQIIKSDFLFLIADQLWSSVAVREKAFLNVHDAAFAINLR
ncbi:MAG: hypothetical protein AABZ31_14085 [Bdellovibrionota bacterium]